MSDMTTKRPVWFKEPFHGLKGRVDADNVPYVKFDGKPESKTDFKNNTFYESLLGGEEISQEEYEQD